jgi:hypothetical protein
LAEQVCRPTSSRRPITGAVGPQWTDLVAMDASDAIGRCCTTHWGGARASRRCGHRKRSAVPMVRARNPTGTTPGAAGPRVQARELDSATRSPRCCTRTGRRVGGEPKHWRDRSARSSCRAATLTDASTRDDAGRAYVAQLAEAMTVAPAAAARGGTVAAVVNELSGKSRRIRPRARNDGACARWPGPRAVRP